MNITEEDLILELEQIQADAQEAIIENHKEKGDQNSYGMGWEAGARDTCDRLLQLIKKGYVD